MGIDVSQFLEVARPALKAGDADALAAAINQRWRPKTLCSLLGHADHDVRRVAAITLGLVGDGSCVGCLARALHDTDAQVTEMAEHALWSIWFRDGDPAAAEPFAAGMTLLAEDSDDAHQQAIDRFREAIRIDPAFAEAHNQCSIARFFLGHWRDCIEDCQQALLRQPCHFGAMAGMGHCYAHLGDLHKALDCYRRAVAINPRLTAIANAVRRLEAELDTDPLNPEPTHQPTPSQALDTAPRLN